MVPGNKPSWGYQVSFSLPCDSVEVSEAIFGESAHCIFVRAPPALALDDIVVVPTDSRGLWYWR